MVDEDGDGFRQFHGTALKANNIIRLLDFKCFRTEWDYRDCFDLVSKYLLTLKTYPCVGCVSGEH
jgi:hypothetical protein